MYMYCTGFNEIVEKPGILQLCNNWMSAEALQQHLKHAMNKVCYC